MNHPIPLILLWVTASQFVIAANTPAKPDIDIIAATVNGQPMAELTVELVTDLFGRPTATTDPRTSHIGEKTHDLPSQLIYGDLGLVFLFQHPRSDSKQRLERVRIHLSQHTDDDTYTVIKTYSGTLNPAMNGNWKAKRVMEEFAAYEPVDIYSATLAQALRETTAKSRALGMPDRTAEDSWIISIMSVIEFRSPPATLVRIRYEQLTKFLEEVEVVPAFFISTKTRPPQRQETE